MTAIKEMLETFACIAHDPKAAFEKQVATGRPVIGVGPYYVPEELVHAAGAIPFGVWGCVGPSVKAKKYFPPFYCSMCQMTLEMGLDHRLSGLSGIMVTGLCDTLKAFSQNWKAGVGDIPMIYVSQPQNRKIAAGRDYAIASYQEVKQHVEECCGAIIDDDTLSASIKLYNQWRAAMRLFVKLAGLHPAEVSVSARTSVIDAGYYLEKDEHLAMVKQLNDALSALPSSREGFSGVVVSGIYQDIPALVEMLDTNKYAVVADDLAKESRAFALCVPEIGDPIDALADGWCNLEADSLLLDPEKLHVSKVVALAKESNAKGVIIFLAKFCDPEEFDAPLVTKACRQAGIACITIEIDQSTESYEQARTQLEAFGELLH